MYCVDAGSMASFGLYNLDELVLWEKSVDRICVDVHGGEAVIYIYTHDGLHYGLVFHSRGELRELVDVLINALRPEKWVIK